MLREASPHESVTLPGMRLSLLGGITVVACAATLAHLGNSSPPTNSGTFPIKATRSAPVLMSTGNYAF